ncbi:MAG: MarR family transcriptional regulator [Rhodoferax sp.]
MGKAEFEALADFRHRLRLFLRFSEELCNRAGIKPLQYQLLLQLAGYPGRSWATVTELAQRLQAQHHGVVALVTRCETAGLVRRQTNTEDLRRVEIHLTDRGAACVDLLARQHAGELGRFLHYCGDITADNLPHALHSGTGN